MDVTKLGAVQPASAYPNRPQGAGGGSQGATTGSTANNTALSVTASPGDGGEPPDPSTPRGSLLDISI